MAGTRVLLSPHPPGPMGSPHWVQRPGPGPEKGPRCSLCSGSFLLERPPPEQSARVITTVSHSEGRALAQPLGAPGEQACQPYVWHLTEPQRYESTGREADLNPSDAQLEKKKQPQIWVSIQGSLTPDPKPVTTSLFPVPLYSSPLGAGGRGGAGLQPCPPQGPARVAGRPALEHCLTDGLRRAPHSTSKRAALPLSSGQGPLEQPRKADG